MYEYLLITVFLLFAILAWRNLKLALVLLCGLLPTYLLRFSVGPIPTTALEILILICVIVFLAKLITDLDARRDLLNKKNKWIYPTILLIASASFGVVAPDTFSALGIWKAYFIEPIFVALMMLSVFKKRDWTNAFKVMSICAIVLSILAIIQYLTGIGIPAPWDIELRATSIFDYPNALGLFLAPIITLNLVKLLTNDPLNLPLGRGRRKNKTPLLFKEGLGVVTIILASIAIILSQTEAALVAIPTATIITLLISKISKKKKLILLVLSVMLITLSLTIPVTREKLLLQDYSGQVRISQWSETLELAKDHPFFGAGLNGYPTAIAQYHDSTLYEIFQYPHNIFLNIWSELGILGLVAFCWFAWLVIRIIISQFPTPTLGGASNLVNSNIQLMVFAALLTMLIHGLVDAPYFKNDLSVMTWVLFAMFVAMTDNNK